MKFSRRKLEKATIRYSQNNCHRCNSQASIVLTIRKPRDLKQPYALICEDCARPNDEIITAGFWFPDPIKSTDFKSSEVH